jgi:outer membrane lipoprotein-sorting protein
MIDDKLHESDRELDDIVDALRDMQVPSGPTDSFRRRLVDRLATQSKTSAPAGVHPDSRRKTMKRVFSIAATLLVISAVLGWLASQNRSPAGSAFAQMLQQVSKARTATYTTQVDMRGQSPMYVKAMVLEPDWVREEMNGEDYRHVIVFNMRERKSLTLMPATKKAVLRRMLAGPATPPKSAIEQIREVRESSAEFLGREQVDGQETLKYRCDHPMGHFLLWFNPDNNLPVKAVTSEASGDAEAFVTITFTNFQWNVPLEESLFTLEAPAGYELELEQAAGPSLDPKNFITTMKVYVRLNHDQFPDEFNVLTPGSMIKFLDDPTLPPEERMANYRRKLARALDRPDMVNMSKEQWQEEGAETGRVFGLGAVYLQMLLQSHDWHYVGKGVKLGEADKIVAWWAPKVADSGKPKMATVLYGDLRVATQPAEGLPIAE